MRCQYLTTIDGRLHECGEPAECVRHSDGQNGVSRERYYCGAHRTIIETFGSANFRWQPLTPETPCTQASIGKS